MEKTVKKKVKSIDKLPNILKVKPTINSCDERTPEGGSILHFKVHFSCMPLPVAGHWIHIGLRGGLLKVDVNPLIINDIQPAPVVSTEIELQIDEAYSEEMKATPKAPSLTSKRDRKESCQGQFCQIIAGGGPSTPHWFFQTYDKAGMLIGIADNLTAHFNEQENHLGCGAYSFDTTENDWCFKIVPPSNLRPLRSAFARLIKVRPKAAKEAKSLADKYRNVSEGEWL